MAQYKVPQDVEADDKLIGPFSFRQFVYLLIAGGLVGIGVALFQVFPALAIIPVPFILFLLALALPIKKDQPMETYLAAIISFYLKPRKRVWTPGQRESTILITAPKKIEESRTRNITGEEATHRLSFLADIVDSEGYAIKGIGTGVMRDDLIAEAAATPDMFENYRAQVINRVIDQDKMTRHTQAIREMKEAISKHEAMTSFDRSDSKPAIIGANGQLNRVEPKKEGDRASTAAAGMQKERSEESSAVTGTTKAKGAQKVLAKSPKPAIIELANNSDFSVATIAKEANRLNRKDKSEVFVSLH